VASSLLEQEQGVISSIINIAETCPVLTIRATAYFALGLVATTRPGAMALGEKGWACVRHGRGEPWPIAPEYQLPGEITASPANTVSPAPSRSDVTTTAAGMMYRMSGRSRRRKVGVGKLM